ncbi:MULTISPECIES: ATP-binding protein [unclassified Nocardiopsis]|uniref:ATP-binding protein n=1 Tax=unclassified Nocardiopsis TaxID=2649073 RepID=UPI001357C03A|nr:MULTISPECIES: ATP-binding protein [unclassified Nocardiopsis]
MTVLPRPRRPLDLDRRWRPRAYPAVPAAIGIARADLRADLALVVGAGAELVAAMVLCASEMFADTVDRALSLGEPEDVVRTLALRHPAEGGRVLRLSVAEREAARAVAGVPCADDWGEVVRGQGLVLVDHFADRWGTRRTASSSGVCGGVIWAEFDLPR